MPDLSCGMGSATAMFRERNHNMDWHIPCPEILNWRTNFTVPKKMILPISILIIGTHYEDHYPCSRVVKSNWLEFISQQKKVLVKLFRMEKNHLLKVYRGSNFESIKKELQKSFWIKYTTRKIITEKKNKNKQHFYNGFIPIGLLLHL